MHELDMLEKDKFDAI
jgi:hypothetical protein